MKYLPKSKIAAAAAILYLLLVFLLIVSGIFGGGGLHGAGSMAFVFAFGLTLPLSLFAFGDATAGKSDEYISAGILAVSAILNAAVIYLVVGFVSRTLGMLFRRLK